MANETDDELKSTLAQLTADIVAAYVGNNSVPAEELPEVIAEVHGALAGASGAAVSAVKSDIRPAVPVNRSLTDDAISCLYCGKTFASLKRHIRSIHKVSPDEYREQWGLREDYPMSAPRYTRARSAMAKKMGLGRIFRPR